MSEIHTHTSEILVPLKEYGKTSLLIYGSLSPGKTCLSLHYVYFIETVIPFLEVGLLAFCWSGKKYLECGFAI